jgi:hypothetical protein
VLRGWGNYFRTGNAGREFHKMDNFAGQELAPLAVPHRLMGTVRCPAQSHTRKIIVKPCAGKRLARLERGIGNRLV